MPAPLQEGDCHGKSDTQGPFEGLGVGIGRACLGRRARRLLAQRERDRGHDANRNRRAGHRRRRSGPVRRAQCCRARRASDIVREDKRSGRSHHAFKRQDSRRRHSAANGHGRKRQRGRMRYGHHASEQLQRSTRPSAHRDRTIKRHRRVDREARRGVDHRPSAVLRSDRAPHAYHRRCRQGTDRCARRKHERQRRNHADAVMRSAGTGACGR